MVYAALPHWCALLCTGHHSNDTPGSFTYFDTLHRPIWLHCKLCIWGLFVLRQTPVMVLSLEESSGFGPNHRILRGEIWLCKNSFFPPYKHLTTQRLCCNINPVQLFSLWDKLDYFTEVIRDNAHYLWSTCVKERKRRTVYLSCQRT